LGLVTGIVYLVLGISSLMLSRGYFKGRERARHMGRTMAVLAIAFALFCLLLPVPAKLGPDSPF
jgi:preprotein translocase subunit SecG